jgi:mannosyltransferase OCH1-like enzyme
MASSVARSSGEQSICAVIPRRLIRTVPEKTSAEVERWWEQACDLHPMWEHITYRDPVGRADFPLTSHLFNVCESGAQLADLIRAEALYRYGGIYLDSDVEVYRSLEPLTHLQGFAGYEDAEHIPNAVMGFEAQHPAIGRVVKLAVERRHLGTWAAGVGVTTEVFAGRDDMLILPPGTLYPTHYRDADRDTISTDSLRAQQPWAYCRHYWRKSWA